MNCLRWDDIESKIMVQAALKSIQMYKLGAHAKNMHYNSSYEMKTWF